MGAAIECDDDILVVFLDFLVDGREHSHDLSGFVLVVAGAEIRILFQKTAVDGVDEHCPHLVEHFVGIRSGGTPGFEQHLAVAEDDGHGFGRGVFPPKLVGRLVVQRALLHNLVGKECRCLFLSEGCGQGGQLLMCLLDGGDKGCFLLSGDFGTVIALRVCKADGQGYEENENK